MFFIRNEYIYNIFVAKMSIIVGEDCSFDAHNHPLQSESSVVLEMMCFEDALKLKNVNVRCMEIGTPRSRHMIIASAEHFCPL